MKHKRSIISIALATIMLVSLCAVCASTSVSAAQGSSSNVLPSAALVGATPAQVLAGTGPAVASRGNGQFDLFWIAPTPGTTYGTLMHKLFDGKAWGPAEDLKGKCTSSPAAVNEVWVAVFVRCTNGGLYRFVSADGLAASSVRVGPSPIT